MQAPIFHECWNFSWRICARHVVVVVVVVVVNVTPKLWKAVSSRHNGNIKKIIIIKWLPCCFLTFVSWSAQYIQEWWNLKLKLTPHSFLLCTSWIHNYLFIFGRWYCSSCRVRNRMFFLKCTLFFISISAVVVASLGWRQLIQCSAWNQAVWGIPTRTVCIGIPLRHPLLPATVESGLNRAHPPLQSMQRAQQLRDAAKEQSHHWTVVPMQRTLPPNCQCPRLGRCHRLSPQQPQRGNLFRITALQTKQNLKMRWKIRQGHTIPPSPNPPPNRQWSRDGRSWLQQ